MTLPDSDSPQNYWCFISYRHADNQVQDREWASWIHREIERYEVPAELVGKENERGLVIPERIYPVFRDEESLPADASLANSITSALDRSQFLLVLCSPQAVESRYVAQEIEHFQQGENSDRIVAAIISGEPGDPERECFPDPLREAKSKNSQLLEPIAADFRLPGGAEGYTSVEAYKRTLSDQSTSNAVKLAESYESTLQLMKLKIIAGILGVPLELLRNRDKAYQLELARERSRKLRAWLTAVGIACAAAVGTAFYANHQRLYAKAQEEIAVSKKQEAEQNLIAAKFEEAKAWLERSNIRKTAANNLGLDKNQETRRLIFESIFLAARGLEFHEFGDSSPPDFLPADTDRSLQTDLVSSANNLLTQIQVWRRPIILHSKSSITAVAWSPDGSTVVSSSSEGSPEFWDPNTGQYRGEIDYHLNCNDVAWNHDSSQIASGAKWKSIQIRDATSYAFLHELKGHTDEISALAWHPSEPKLTSASDDGTLIIWNTEKGTRSRQISAHQVVVSDVDWNPDGTRLVSCAQDGSVSVWNAEDGERVAFTTASNYSISSVDWHPTQSLIACAIADGNIRILNSDTLEVVSTIGNPGESFVNEISWSPDGTLIGSASADGAVRIWSTETSALTATLDHPTEVTSLSWNPEGTRICTGEESGAIEIWNLEQENSLPTDLGHRSRINCIDWKPREASFVTGSEFGKLIIWDAVNGKPTAELEAHTTPISALDWHPEGKQISCSSGTLASIWNAETLEQVANLDLHTSTITCLAYSPDGTQIASGSRKGNVVLWETVNHTPILLIEADPEGVNDLTWEPDGKRIATAGNDCSVKVWDTSNGDLVRELDGHLEAVRSVAWNPRTKLIASAAEDETTRVWSPDSGELVFQHSANQYIVGVCRWSPDGSQLATCGGLHDGSLVAADIVIYDFDSNSFNRLFETDGTLGLSWSPNGKALVSTAADGSVTLWPRTQPAVDLKKFIENRWLTLDGSTFLWSHGEMNPGLHGWLPSHPNLARELLSAPK